VVGARQVGKSTLVGGLADRHYVTLDDVGALASAAADPRAFVAALPRPATIDEVQRVPQLLLAIKEVVDRDRSRGAFLLTGSSRLDTLRGVRESLAGRAALVELGPLTWTELLGKPAASPLDRLFGCADVRDAAAVYGAVRADRRPGGDDFVAGGFPEPVLHTAPAARGRWFREYVRTYIERDVPAIVRIEDVPAFVRFVTACASSSASLLNLSELARDLGVSVDTAKRWVGVLESTFVALRRSPFWRNVRTRLVKSPKLFLADSGLMAALLGASDWAGAQSMNVAGAIHETWVHQQLHALTALAAPPTELHFYRTHTQVEVDFVLGRAGRLVPLEIKLGTTIRPADARGIDAFVEQFPRHARFGLVLHGGTGIHPVTDKALAVPLAAFLAP
jgi:predicted AAA+ superfamily ATPase